MTRKEWTGIMPILITVSIMNILTNKAQTGKGCRKHLCQDFLCVMSGFYGVLFCFCISAHIV